MAGRPFVLLLAAMKPVHTPTLCMQVRPTGYTTNGWRPHSGT
jgi:hypothetical protein